METEKYYFRVGLFCLAVLMGLVYLLFAFGGHRDSRHFTRYAIFFDNSVNGLARGAPVKLRGIEVGLVEDIHFISRDNDRIAVIADIVDNAPIRMDTVASIEYQGITGTSYIGLENAGTAAPTDYLTKLPGHKYPVIQSEKSGLQNVLSNAPELMGQLAETNGQLQKLLSDANIAAFQGILAQTQDVLTQATVTLREFKKLARMVQDNPSSLLRGTSYDGYKVKK